MTSGVDDEQGDARDRQQAAGDAQPDRGVVGPTPTGVELRKPPGVGLGDEPPLVRHAGGLPVQGGAADEGRDHPDPEAEAEAEGRASAQAKRSPHLPGSGRGIQRPGWARHRRRSDECGGRGDGRRHGLSLGRRRRLGAHAWRCALRVALLAHPGHVAPVLRPGPWAQRGELRGEGVEDTDVGAARRDGACIVSLLVKAVRLKNEVRTLVHCLVSGRHRLEGSPALVGRREVGRAAVGGVGGLRLIFEPNARGFVVLPGFRRSPGESQK